jgi:glycosyltransferase involved in cell wall biosynthesis
MRYVYVKNGDAIAQVRQIARATEVARSGPDAFIGDFLKAHAKDEVLVLCRTSRRSRFQLNSVIAKGFAAGGALRRGPLAVQIGIEILRWRPERILCGCTGELLWVCTVAANLLNVPLVHARHNEVRQRRGVRRIVSALDQRSMRACTGVACHGPFLTAQLRALDIARERMQEFEVDLADFAEADFNAEVPLAVRDFVRRCAAVLVFVGRVQRDKGVFDLLEAFSRLVRQSDRTVGLIYVGDERDLGLLRDRVGKLQLDQAVLVLGRVPHTDLPAVMCRARAVVAPTRPEFPEGRCMVVLESLVLGVPVVAPDSGPFPYAIAHETNGLLFARGDREDLRRCLMQIASGTRRSRDCDAGLPKVRDRSSQPARASPGLSIWHSVPQWSTAEMVNADIWKRRFARWRDAGTQWLGFRVRDSPRCLPRRSAPDPGGARVGFRRGLQQLGHDIGPRRARCDRRVQLHAP